MRVVRVTLADDHQIIRVGLRALIAAQPDMKVVGEAGSVRALLRIVAAEKPDVAVLDIHMPDGSGLSALDSMRELSPHTRALVLTMHADPDTVRRALLAGAHGFVTKSADPEEVVGAVRALAAGRSYLSTPLSQASLGDLLSVDRPTASPPAAKTLSQRETEVLALFARGYTHRQIAARLGVQIKTVETYRNRLGAKFGARTRSELLHSARALGLLDDVAIEPPPPVDPESSS